MEYKSEVVAMIDNRIQVGLAVHTKRITANVKEEMRREWDDFQSKAMDEMKQTAEQIFANMEFMEAFKEDIYYSIRRNIKKQMQEDGLNKIIRDIASSVTKSVFDDIIKEVIEEITKQTQRKLRREHQVAKDLCYSINADIKHCLMNSGISYESEEIIKQKMMETIQGVSNKLLSTIKKPKELEVIENE